MVLQIAPQKTKLKPELKSELSISWEPLPEDFELPDDPVENDQQPILAAALTDALRAAGLVKPEMLIVSNFALVAKVDGYTNVKAPDWLYVPKVKPGTEGIFRRSYTPNLQGSPVAVVMEFVSDNDGEEYSSRESRPYGKVYFYEQILQVPTYVIYNPYEPSLQVRCLKNGCYVFQLANAQGRFWIPELELFIGIWRGEKLQQTINWLRWWDNAGNLLLWSSERTEQERQRAEQERQRAEQSDQRAEQERQRAEQSDQRAEQERQRAEQERQRAEQERQRAEQLDQQAEQERQRAEQERQRAEQFANKLRELGIDPNTIS